MFRPYGVCTGSLKSNCVVNRPGVPATGTAPSARVAKRRNRIAPRESRSSCTSHARSTGHASLTSTGPLDPTIVGRRLAEGRELVAPQLARVLAVVEHDVLELLARELVAGPAVGAGQPLLRHHEARPLAQRALGALVADDPVESLQRLVGIRDPVAVVGVHDVVVCGAASAGSTGRRCPARPHPGRSPTRMSTASRRAPAARAPRRSRVPSTVLHVVAFSFGHVRDDGDVRVQRVALGVRRDRVDPRHALVAHDHFLQLVDALRLVHLEEVVQVAEVAGVGVADRPRGRGRPREQRQAQDARSGSEPWCES